MGAKSTSHHARDLIEKICPCSNTTSWANTEYLHPWKRACRYENRFSNEGKLCASECCSLNDLRCCHNCYLKDCQPRLLRPACRLRTFIPREFLRDVRCCTNSYRKDVEPNCKAPPAFGASGFHPLVVNSVAAILSQHAKNSSPLTEKIFPPSLDTGKHEKRRRGLRGQIEKPWHVLNVQENTRSA